jgi:hypothetical protein
MRKPWQARRTPTQRHVWAPKTTSVSDFATSATDGDGRAELPAAASLTARSAAIDARHEMPPAVMNARLVDVIAYARHSF